MQPIITPDQIDAVMAAPVALVYKHSTRCPVSTAAYHEVQRLVEERPEAPVWIVDVIAQRRLSQAVEARTGVQHESPQVVLLVAGEVVYDASHFAVRADDLARELDAAEAETRG